MNSNQGLVLYSLARTRDEQIARDSMSPAALARREVLTTRQGRPRRRRRGWWSR